MNDKSLVKTGPLRLGGYLIESLLARGGMGEVYLAFDERLERRVAIKRIRGDVLADERRRARFRREALAVARINHPAVVQIYDLLEVPEGDCIVMEYVAGTPLRKLAANRPLELQLVLRLAGEIADGLAEMHSKGLVHRDLKSENVLVTSAGHAKILDFGLATRTWGDEDRTSLTESGAIVGTLHAMSPEQANGKMVDHRSDLFSFGVLLYEMLTSRSPFRGKSVLDTLRRVSGETPRPVQEWRPAVPAPLAELIERLLAKDPGQRPASVRLVAMELTRLGHGSEMPPILAEDASETEVTRDLAAIQAAEDDSDELPTVSGVRPLPDLLWRPGTGRTIPRRENWRLEKRIGNGGFGEVWRARHRATGEARVFKFCFDEERRQALEREVTLFRLLREALGERDDIARIFDWSFDPELSFLESEYTESGDLAAWAENQGGLERIPLETRLELAAEIADALAAAHSVGVLHKDVKPGNVLITLDRGGRPHIRLSDFGVGLLTDSERLKAAEITAMGFTESGIQSGSGGGTLRYLAPELIAGEAPTIQSDIYSLGVMLYQMVVGDFSRVLAPGWHREIDDELLCDDIARFVDGVPERRPASAAEVAELLRRLEERRQRRSAERLARREEERLARDLERARKRRRWLAGVAAVTGAVLVVVAFLTVRAEEARREAERRRDQAESLIGFMLGDLRQELEPIGRLAVLGEVGEKALEYFASVPEENLSDEELRHRARALYQIGSVYLDLGRFPAAGEAFSAALRLAGEQTARNAEDDEWQFELGQSFFWVGNYFLQERDLDRAQEHFQAYFEIAELLVARDPGRDDWWLELAYAHSNLASVLDARGEPGAALAELEPSVAAFETLLERQPRNAGWHLELSHVLSKMGSLRKGSGDLAGAAESFEATLEIRRRLADQSPDDADVERHLAAIHNHLGDLRKELGQSDRALEHFEACLELNESLAARDPDNATTLRELVVSHHDVGGIYQTLGDLARAGEHLRIANGLSQELLERDPERARWLLEAAFSQKSLAALHLAEGLPERALERASEAMALFDSIAESRPDDAQVRRLSSETHWLLGRIRHAMGESRAAHEAWNRALETLEPLTSARRDARYLETRLLEIRILPLLSLDRLDEARPIAAELSARGYREPRFIELCRSKGICQPS